MTPPGLQLRHAGAIAATALLAVGVVGTSAGAVSSAHALTIYAVATRAQYADHADDRARGEVTNPFNADTKALKGTGKGSRAGDNALYSFKLYSDPSFKKLIGSAVYSCTFNSAHVALCTADFELSGGAMSASGPTDFDSTTFTLAVSGGTGKYLGARGQVSSAPAAKDAHRLTFLLR
jgi:hypothetical protein